MIAIKAYLTRFRDDEDGVIAIELCLAVPILVWALLSTLVYFDAFRMESINTRAGLTIADMISREQVSVDDNYIDSMQEVLRSLTSSPTAADIRVTVFRYRASDDTYRIVWSKNRGLVGGELTHADLEDLRDRLPLMADNARSVLVEMRNSYRAPFKMGMGPFFGTNLGDFDFQAFTVITPRFRSSICFDPTPASPSNGDEAC